MTPHSQLCRYAVTILVSLALSACAGGETASSSRQSDGRFAQIELDVAYPEAFSFLQGVREMPDGSVLAADPLSQVLLRLDLASGTADTLGRVGEGPQEYKQPDQVFPLPGDSTLLVDIGKVQLTIVDPQGEFHTGMKIATASDDGRLSVVMPRFVDDNGFIYMTGSRSMEGPQDSTEVQRYDRSTEEATTLGWTWRPEPIITRDGDNVSMAGIQMAARDDWAAGPKGEFAIVRAHGYQVEWYYPDGRTVVGPPNAVETPRITDDDKLAYLENRGSDGLMMMMSMSSSGAMSMSMSRGGGGMMGGDDEPNLRDGVWAENFAPFRPDRATISPRGNLWVQRWLRNGESPQFDVFDGQGMKLGTVDLPQDRSLLGFGTTTDGSPALYLVRTDEFDLKWLERYRLIR